MKNLISNKNALFDLIYFSNFKGDKQHEPRNVEEKRIYKQMMTSRQEEYYKLFLINFFGAVSKLMYARLIIRKIEVVKEMFLAEIEHNDKAYIPKEMS